MQLAVAAVEAAADAQEARFIIVIAAEAAVFGRNDQSGIRIPDNDDTGAGRIVGLAVEVSF